MGMNVIDRRLNPSGKSLPNRQRLLRVAKETIKEQVIRSIREKNLSDVGGKEVVNIPMKRIAEPRLRHASTGGDRDQVFPGNKEFVAGDTLPKPKSGGGDKETEKKHNDFVERMVARGYTARQTRRLVEWYMRVDKAG